MKRINPNWVMASMYLGLALCIFSVVYHLKLEFCS